jgi:hypothetical protein
MYLSYVVSESSVEMAPVIQNRTEPRTAIGII